MCASHGLRERRGWTLIEMMITVGVVAILAAIALPSVSFARFRMDGAARQVQLRFIAAQSKSIEQQQNYLVTFFWSQSQFRVVNDKNGNGLWDGGVELRNWFTLPEKIHFMIPPSTIDGAAPAYATGPGVHMVGSGGNYYPSITFYPNGSTSGDVVVYMGTQSTRLSDFRAVQITGATSKMKYWRMQADGTWKLSTM
jgi:prepilin-type N-terminal cleavage/methylation domain-containing protein